MLLFLGMGLRFTLFLLLSSRLLDASSLVMQAFVRLFAYFLWVVLLESAWNIPIITRRKPATLKASMMTWLKMTEPERERAL
jgi:hypothetical protein